MQYNIQQTSKTNWTNLVMETEQAIRQLETKVQNAPPYTSSQVTQAVTLYP